MQVSNSLFLDLDFASEIQNLQKEFENQSRSGSFIPPSIHREPHHDYLL